MKNIFGTDGIRCRVGSGFLTGENLIHIGSCIASFLVQKYGRKSRLVIMQDTRISGDFIKAALKTGLLHHDVHIIDAHILPTPAVSFLMKKVTAHSALVISASHNPYYDNGIKIFNEDGQKIDEANELLLSHLIEQREITAERVEHFGTEEWYCTAQEDYINAILNQFTKPFGKKHTVVLDVAYGSTYNVAQRIFEKLGFNVIMLHDKPNGYNINENCGSLFPQKLQDAVIKENALVGFAFDGDGDRVVAVSRHGQLKDGDDILALLMNSNRFSAQKTLVGTIMTNGGFEKYVHTQGKKLLRTAVGDKFVAQKLQENELSLGGEPSGHILLRLADMLVGDGILVAGLVLESIINANNLDMDTFDHFPNILTNLPIVKKYDLMEEPFFSIIDQAQQALIEGKVIVRYSGTEPLLRIMVEAQTRESAEEMISVLSKKLQPLLG